MRPTIVSTQAVDCRMIAIATDPGATHAFDIDEPARTFRGSRLTYDAAAAREAQIQRLPFLLRIVTTPSARRGPTHWAE